MTWLIGHVTKIQSLERRFLSRGLLAWLALLGIGTSRGVWGT